MALSKPNRLGSSRDFGRVHRKGNRAATKHLAVRALKQKKRIPSEIGQPESADGKPSALLFADRRANRRAGSAAVDVPESQFGISISKKVSKKAVVRNRIKRQIKAIIRQMLANIRPGWQVVIVVRTAAVECEFDDFLRELEYLFKKVGICSKSAAKPPLLNPTIKKIKKG